MQNTRWDVSCKGLTFVGVVLMSVFGLGLVTSFPFMLMQEGLWPALALCSPIAAFFGGGAAMTWVGRQRTKKAKRYRKYLALIGKRDSGAASLPITDMRMTRFNISLQAGVDLVLWAIEHHLGGEIFIPKIPSYHIKDVATAIAPGIPQVEVGIRPGEKLHEEMIPATDALNTIDIGRYYAILPSVSFQHTREDYIRHHGGVPVPDGFHYSSDKNSEWETVESMREKIKEFVDPDFEVK